MGLTEPSFLERMELMGLYPSRTHTHADRIRSMSDEELAELFSHLGCPYFLGGKVDCNTENKGCKACWLDWLRQEAQDM